MVSSYRTRQSKGLNMPSMNDKIYEEQKVFERNAMRDRATLSRHNTHGAPGRLGAELGGKCVNQSENHILPRVLHLPISERPVLTCRWIHDNVIYRQFPNGEIMHHRKWAFKRNQDGCNRSTSCRTLYAWSCMIFGFKWSFTGFPFLELLFFKKYFGVEFHSEVSSRHTSINKNSKYATFKKSTFLQFSAILRPAYPLKWRWSIHG